MLRDFTSWLKNYLAETLLSLCIVLVLVLSVLAGTWLGYAVGLIVIIALGYFLLQLRKAAKLRLERLQELDKGNREQLLNNNKAFNPHTVVKEITGNLRYATEFVREIGKGNFDARLEGITEENFDLNKENLAGELVNMKIKMKATAEEEKKRVWATQGLANFGDLLRTSSHDLSKLSEEVIIFIVKYLKANQGGIFILNDDDSNNRFLELKAAYAFERKKFLTKKINIGEGLVGQAFLERETIHLRKLPPNYVSITSGLGGANPHTLILVPLKVEEDVMGVMEIASFKNFEQHEIEFCEKIGETIASTFSSAKVNERTRTLLEQSQQQAEEMRAQEEEMRQNMEELQATQESMERVAKESQDKEAYLKSILDSSTDAMMSIDHHYKIAVLNKSIYETFKKQGVELRVGQDVFTFSKGDRSLIKDRYDRVFRGETILFTEEYFGKHYEITTTPINNQDGEIVGACVFTKDVTNDILLKKKTEEMLQLESRKAEEIMSNRKLLLSLTRNEHVQSGAIDKALETITEVLASRLSISRAAVWLYQPESQSILLSKLFESDKRQYAAGMQLFQKDIPRYFQSITDEEVIVAPDAFQHEAISEFKVGYLDVLNIKSMLDVPFFIDGEVGGVICCENQGTQKNWSAEEVDFTKSVADILTIAFKSAKMKSLLENAHQHAGTSSHETINWRTVERVGQDLKLSLEAARIAENALKRK